MKHVVVFTLLVLLIAGHCLGQETQSALGSPASRIDELEGRLLESAVQPSYEIPENALAVSKIGSLLASLRENRSLWYRLPTETTRQIPGAVELYQECAPGVVLLAALDGSALGSGSLLDPNGTVITNYHVVGDCERVAAVFFDDDITDLAALKLEDCMIADVIATDQSRDLALVQLPSNPHGLEGLRLCPANEIRIAQDVFAIGHPHGLLWSFTYGVISQLRENHEWTYGEGRSCRADVIQTQTPTNPGNSGGPLFNDDGRLVGINSFGSSEAQGLNFAIRVDEITEFMVEAQRGQHKPTDRAKESSVEWDYYDTNDNGVIDAIGIDSDNDGMDDTWGVDSDEDGELDYIDYDTNQDGVADVRILDLDGDGHSEHWIIDQDYDGVFDTEAVDTDGDGVADLEL